MTFKRFAHFALILALFAGVLAAVSAKDDNPRFGRFGSEASSAILQEATGLDADGIRAALAEGSTLAELIEANGGDVAGVIEALIAEASSTIDEAMATRKAELDDRITAWVNGTHGMGGYRGMVGEMLPLVEAATGLDAAEIQAALADGSTLAELIEANGGDVTTVMSELATTVMESRMEALASGDLDQQGKAPWGRRGPGRGRR